jgi:hypothetical protein
VSVILQAGLLALAALAQQSAEPPVGPAISIDRVREKLLQPAPFVFVLPEPTVHFRLDIMARPYFPDLPPIDFGSGKRAPAPPFWVPRGPMPQVGTTPALIGFDALAIARGVSRAMTVGRRTAAQRAAREEALRALREFCATTRECEVR